MTESTEQSPSTAVIAVQKAPVKAMFICIGITWILFLIPIMGLGFIGFSVNLAVLILAIVCLCKSKIGAGITGLIFSITINPLVYLIGTWIFAAMIYQSTK